MKLLLCRRQWE